MGIIHHDLCPKRHRLRSGNNNNYLGVTQSFRFFFYAQKALNRGISQKKKSSVVILCAFIWVKIRHLIHFLNSQWNLSSKINAPLLTWNFVKAVHFAFQKTHHQSIEFSHRNERKNRKWVLIGYACYYPIELLFIPLCK